MPKVAITPWPPRIWKRCKAFPALFMRRMRNVPAAVEITRWSVIGLLSATLAIVSLSDIRYRRIPNRAVLVICCLSVPWILLGPGPTILSASGAILIAFAISWPLYAFGLIGAGDSKLLMSVA